MSEIPESIMTEILNRVDRAWRNKQRLHLEVEHVRYLLQPRIYEFLSRIKAEELQARWVALDEAARGRNENASRPDTSTGLNRPARYDVRLTAQRIREEAQERQRVKKRVPAGDSTRG